VVIGGARQQGVELLDGALGLLRLQVRKRQGEARLPVAAVELQDLLEDPDGLGVALLPDVEFRQAQPVAHAQGVLLDEPAVNLPGPGGFVLDLAEQRKIGEGGLEAGLQGQGLFHPRRGLLVEPHLPVNLAEVVVAHDALRVPLEERSQSRHGLVVALVLGVDHAQVEVGVVVFRVQRDDAPVGPDGLLVVLLEEVDASHERVGLRALGVVDEGLFADGERPVEVAHLDVQRGQLPGQEGRLGVQGQGLFVLRGRLPELAVQGEHRADRVVVGGIPRRVGRRGLLCRCGGGKASHGRQRDGQQDCVPNGLFHGLRFLSGFLCVPAPRGACRPSTSSASGTKRIPAADNRGIASSRALTVSG